MKKLFIVLLFATSLMQGQDLKEWIRLYEADCAQIVKDTVQQEGEVKYKMVPVNNASGEVIYYGIHPLDTVWQDVECPKYKESSWQHNSLTNTWSDNITYQNVYQRADGTYFYDTEISPASASLKKLSITRDYVCECEKKEVESFSRDFWNFIKTHKDE